MLNRRRWRFILNIVEHLPAHSRYMAAVADDEEVAAQMDPDAKPRPPSLTEFDPTVRALAAVYDRLGTLITVTQAAGGAKKPKRLPAYPRPRLAWERLKERARWSKHRKLVDRLLPKD